MSAVKKACILCSPHTLSQVEDGPGHLQPLVPVRHLQRVQQPHYIRPLLLHRQLDPPPASSCRKDTETKGSRLQSDKFNLYFFFCALENSECICVDFFKVLMHFAAFFYASGGISGGKSEEKKLENNLNLQGS